MNYVNSAITICTLSEKDNRLQVIDQAIVENESDELCDVTPLFDWLKDWCNFKDKTIPPPGLTLKIAESICALANESQSEKNQHPNM